MRLKNIPAYISRLLNEHDCVIIPSFGGFVARSLPAHFAKTGGMLMPPYKSIVFNKNLVNNDGLLAGHIMQQEGLSYPQANMAIEQYVKTCKELLQTHKRFELENLGVLYKNNEGALLFEQDAHVNYNLHSFGLSPVRTVKLKEENKKAALTDLTYRERIQEAAASAEKKAPVRIVSAITMALIIITLMFFVTWQNHTNNGMASLNPFGTKNKTTSATVKNTVPAPAKVVSKDTVSVAPAYKDTASVDKTLVVKTEATITEWYKQPYQIVLGCFAVKQNAYKLINQLNSQNLQAEIAGRNAKNLYVVSVAGFNNETEARKRLSEIKEQYSSAWLFKR